MRRPSVRLAILVCVAASLATLLWLWIGTTRDITVSPTEIDFGEVELSTETNRRLTFRNPNRSPAVVRVAADCDCVALSQPELRIPSQGEATIDITLRRLTGDRREDWYTFLESELEVTTVADGEYQGHSIPIKAKFFEPYAVDHKSASVSGLATDLEKVPVRFSATTSETGRPTIGKIPPFAESVQVDWNEEFSAGELLVTIKRDASPRLHQGHIEMRLGSPAETAPKPYLLAFEARVHAPFRFNPGMAILGGLMDADSEIVTLEEVAGLPCSIGSISCDSEWVKVEKHDDASFTVRRTGAGRRGFDESPVIHVLSFGKSSIKCSLQGTPALMSTIDRKKMTAAGAPCHLPSWNAQPPRFV